MTFLFWFELGMWDLIYELLIIAILVTHDVNDSVVVVEFIIKIPCHLECASALVKNILFINGPRKKLY